MPDTDSMGSMAEAMATTMGEAFDAAQVGGLIIDVGNGVEEYAVFDPKKQTQSTLTKALKTPTQLIIMGNPGGPGQHWFRARYIDPAGT